MFRTVFLKNRIFQDSVKNHSEIDEEPIFSKPLDVFVRNVVSVSALVAAPVIEKPVERETLTEHLFFSLS